MPISQQQYEEMKRRTERARGAYSEPNVITTGGLVQPTPKRLRQSAKPLMNKLEAEWFAILNTLYPNYPRPRPQAKTYRLANGLKYTPDFTASIWPVPNDYDRETAWEVKGKKAWDDSIAKVKMAAHEWPEVRWILVWKDAEGLWCDQTILP